ncbi:MAG: hypothetical protein SNJ80_05790 [Anaerolinea sp.]
MEKFQNEALRLARRLGRLAIQGSEWLYLRLEQLADVIYRLLARIPLTPFQWIVVIYLLLGVVYAFATPPFEASDELQHVAYVDAMRRGELPLLQAGSLVGEQAAQPPAYYALAAAFTLPFEPFRLREQIVLNPFVVRSDPFALGNKNLLLPTPQPPDAAPVLLLRVVNILLGVVTIGGAWKAGEMLNARRPAVALLAASLTAFNPMFIFVSASVGNLPLAMALNALLIAAMMHALRDGLRLPLAVGVGVLVGVAAAVHLSALYVGAVWLAVAVYVAVRSQKWQPTAALALAMAAAVIVTLGWWGARNLELYGDLLGWQAWQALFANRTGAPGIDGVFFEWAHFRRSFWGLFGVGNIALGEFAYALLDLLVFIALIGVGFMVMQLYAIRDFAHARRELFNVTALLGVVLLAVVMYGVQAGSQRFVSGVSVFPAMAAIMPVLAAGFIEVVWWLLFLLTPPDRSYVRAGDAVPNEALQPNSAWSARLLMFVAIITPFLTIAPTYAPIAPVVSVSPMAREVYARYGTVELIAYDTDFTRFLPGQLVPVTLYWRVIEPTDTDWTITLAIVPPEGNLLSRLDTFPGWGRLRTSTWQPGSVYADTYYLRLDPFFGGNFPLKLHVQWWSDADARHIPPVNAAGEPIPSVLLEMGALTFPRVAMDTLASLGMIEPRLREFGGLLRLDQFDFDRETYHTTLIWEAMRPMDVDYTMFVQILNSENEIVGQHDTRPALPTRFWNFGERYLTDHIILTDGPLPPGQYRVIVGVYQLETMERLPVGFNPEAEEEEPRDFTLLFEFEITEDGQLLSDRLDQLLPVPPETPTAEATASEDSGVEPATEANPMAAPIAPTSAP